jgi:type II secretory ATPase GspE/PulE/Tfp pilus assembly ATPase PilB-like protein
MGIEPGMLASTLTCLVAQRLVRRVCPDCRETYAASAEEMAELGHAGEQGRILARGAACTACGGTGYRGRVGLFEVLPMTQAIRTLVSERASTAEIQRTAIAEGMRTLRDDGVRLCLEGVTTADEVRRVAGDWDR